jgi:hypothetical protein
MHMTDLNAIVINLARARAERDEVADRVASARAEFEASIAAIVAQKKDADLRVAELEDVARAEAITAYNANPDGGKKPHPALGIRETVKLDYQESHALDWAISHDIRSALKLDKSGFEKLAKAGRVDTVEVGLSLEINISATIATDLSEYLGEAS